MRVIYRVENAALKGFYTTYDARKIWGHGGATKRWSMPYDDAALMAHEWAADRIEWVPGGYTSPEEVRYGFRSTDQLCRWLAKTPRRKLKRLGYTVGVYLVPDDYCALGDTQAAFDVDKAEEIGRLDLTTLTDPRQPELPLEIA